MFYNYSLCRHLSCPHGSHYLVRSRKITKQSNISLCPVITSQPCDSQQTNNQTIKGYERRGSAGCLRSDEPYICVQPGSVQYLRSAISQPARPLYITANEFLPVTVLCLLTGELEMRNERRIKVTGIAKSLFLLGSISADKRKFCVSETSEMVFGPTQPLVLWVMEALSAMVRRPGSEADCSPPPNI
jgi:hypothetical protein